jgi:peptidoglycan/LPS O-acetylase OafA/YrhL
MDIQVLDRVCTVESNATLSRAEIAKELPVTTPGSVWYPGLDGVRGIAVSLVFAVHYIPRYRIGWMGVIVFFVLSGFLITGALYDSQGENHRFRNFYLRRTLRIFPLFYFIWLCVLVTAFFLHEYWRPALVLWPIYLGNYARFLAGTTAVDRIYTRFPWLAIEIGHFWSLAVEEQFYLLWPLVVFKVSNRQTLMRICVAVMVSALLLRTVLVLVLPHSLLQMEFLYRMTFSQADAFLLGGLLALLIRGPEKAAVLRSGSWLFWVSLTTLIVACWLNGPGRYLVNVTPSAPWMSSYGFTLVDLTSGGLILCALRPGNLLFRPISFGPLRELGKYSYGFYVYHVLVRPLLIPFARMSASHFMMILWWCADFVVVFAISAVSYDYLETPFLRLKNRVAARHANPDTAERGARIENSLQTGPCR